MALYTRKEIRSITGITAAHLRVAINRNELSEIDGKIDSDNPKNADWIRNQKEKNKDKAKDKIHISLPEQKPIKEDVVDDVFEGQEETKYQTKEALEKEKLFHTIEGIKLKNAKLKAELIPVDLVKPLFMQFSKSLTTAYQNELESIMIEIEHKYKVSQADRAYFKGRVIEGVNLANQEGVSDVKKNLEHVANQYAEVRGQGESK